MHTLEAAVLWACEQKACRDKHEILQSSSINYVYEKTVSGSALRQFVTDKCAVGTSSTKFATLKDKFPAEFCRDLCELLIIRAETSILRGVVENNSEEATPIVCLPGQRMKRARSESPENLLVERG